MSIVLEARELTRHYEISRGLFKPNALVRALNGVSFQLEAGKTLAVVGESGCGKSTLARALTLIEEPSSGSLQIAGQDRQFAAHDRWKLAARHYIAQLRGTLADRGIASPEPPPELELNRED